MTHYFIGDHLGSVTGLVDSAGALTASQDYRAFGEEAEGVGIHTLSGSRWVQPYGFTGRELDGAGLPMYYRARYYDPGTGRFLSEDPIGLRGGINLYGYGGANPLLNNDPMGLSPEDVGKIVSAHYAAMNTMNTRGLRTDPGIWNNISSSLNSASGGNICHGYLGCVEQADYERSQLKNPCYDDEWNFEMDGSNWPLLDYEGTPHLDHHWLVGKSSNPWDPVIILDPWKNVITFR